MSKTIRTEIKDSDNMDKSFPVRIEIYPSSVDIIIESSEHDVASVAIDYYDGRITGYVWDEDNTGQAPLFHADLVCEEKLDAETNAS